jgi:hypothetical protein
MKTLEFISGVFSKQRYLYFRVLQNGHIGAGISI